MYTDLYETSVHGPSAQWPAQRPTILSLAEVVSQFSGVRVTDITGPGRTAAVAKARHIVSWLARRFTRQSSSVIARHTGGRDHSTALYSIARVSLAICEASIAAPVIDTPEAWTDALWEAHWPSLRRRDPMRLRS
jgi:chromosomal replication initiation ATPase DnaA